MMRRAGLIAYLGRAWEDQLIEEVLLPLSRQLGFHRITAADHRDKALEYGSLEDKRQPVVLVHRPLMRAAHHYHPPKPLSDRLVVNVEPAADLRERPPGSVQLGRSEHISFRESMEAADGHAMDMQQPLHRCGAHVVLPGQDGCGAAGLVLSEDLSNRLCR